MQGKNRPHRKLFVLGAVLAVAAFIIGCPPLTNGAEGDYAVEWGDAYVTVGNENPTVFEWDADLGVYVGDVMWFGQLMEGRIDAQDPYCKPVVDTEAGIITACLCALDPTTQEPTTLCESNLLGVTNFHLIKANDVTLQMKDDEGTIHWSGNGLCANGANCNPDAYEAKFDVWIPRAAGTPEGFWIYVAASNRIDFLLHRGDGWATDGMSGNYELGLDIAVGWTFLGAGTHIRYYRPFSLVQQ